MEIVSEHRDGEITVFTNNSTPEVHLTTRRAEAKASVNENAEPIVVVAENIGSVKEIAQRTEILDEVMASLPTIMQVVPVAEIVAKAKDEAVEAKESAEESAQQAEEAVLRAEEVSAEQAEIAKGYAEEAKTQAEKLASAFKIVGTVPTVADLPKNAEVGHIYLVGNESVTNKPEYVWTASGKWEKFGETVELPTKVSEFENDAGYATETELNNALATKQDKFTVGEGLKLEGNVLSATSTVPEGVYSEENLIGGKDIEIVKKSGGIDENTLACWHFDDSPYDEVSGLGIRYDTTGSYMAGKFGKAIGNLYGGRPDSAEGLLADKIFVKEEWTVDCWLATNVPNASNLEFHYNIGDTSGYYGIKAEYYPVTGVINLLHKYQTIATTTIEPHLKTEDDKPHFAFQKKGVNAEVFVNGKRRLQKDLTNYLSGMSGKQGVTVGGGSSYMKMDELRVSKVARYDGDFEPPTVPYEAGSAGSVINFTGQSGKNIGEVYYSQSSLASDNAGALPLFTGETIASANTIYPDFYAWVESHTELQTTAEEYENALTTYGECAKYVVSNGSLRLPKLTNYIKMANAAEGITQSEAGLPNITGTFGGVLRGDNAAGITVTEGAFVDEGSIGAKTSGAKISAEGYWRLVSFDAAISSKVYGKSDTVTPAHTTLFPWVFAYNASVPASTAQAAEFQEGLSGKADLTFDNANPSQTFINKSVGWGIPDYTAGVSLTANTDITITENGVIAGEISAAVGYYVRIYINGVLVLQVGSEQSQRCRGPFYASVFKGDVVLIKTESNSVLTLGNFYPFRKN